MRGGGTRGEERQDGQGKKRCVCGRVGEKDQGRKEEGRGGRERNEGEEK